MVQSLSFHRKDQQSWAQEECGKGFYSCLLVSRKMRIVHPVLDHLSQDVKFCMIILQALMLLLPTRLLDGKHDGCLLAYLYLGATYVLFLGEHNFQYKILYFGLYSAVRVFISVHCGGESFSVEWLSSISLNGHLAADVTHSEVSKVNCIMDCAFDIVSRGLLSSGDGLSCCKYRVHCTGMILDSIHKSAPFLLDRIQEDMDLASWLISQ